VEDTSCDLTEVQRHQLFALLLEYADVFATDSGDLGSTTCVQHSIETGNARPIRQPPRHIPFVHKEEVHKLLKDMEDQRPLKSPWALPVVLVRKKDGSICISVSIIENSMP